MTRILTLFALALGLLVGPALPQGITGPTGAPAALATTNLSGTITTGNTFQGITGLGNASVPRRSLTIQNNNSTDNCWIYLGATASATEGKAILLTPGQAYTRFFPYLPSDNIAITCATTSDTFYADTQ